MDDKILISILVALCFIFVVLCFIAYMFIVNAFEDNQLSKKVKKLESENKELKSKVEYVKECYRQQWYWNFVEQQNKRFRK